MIQKLEQEIYDGKQIEKDTGMLLWEAPIQELCQAANRIRRHYCGERFDLCTIINGKSGRCTEDCKYCAQSACYHAEVESYPLLATDILTKAAKENEKKGVLRFSVVTSGRALTDQEIEEMCLSYEVIRKESGIRLCASHGLLALGQFKKLKKAGVVRYHNNLETSRRYFPQVCSTHTYDEKIKAIQDAREAGLSVCSGGIIGMGETLEDRVDLALTLRELSVGSIPLNVLNPIPGTPFGGLEPLKDEEVCRTVAIFRFINPRAAIRLAGGRGLLGDKGRQAFGSGANAAISGDMLTTSGITVQTDMELLKELGYIPAACDFD
ncbi:MAG: biotin synthase BioB [Lachnospiraceae bacterium]|nr:biotin synthase BioB [Lachnospiraceae bacterium]